jgi:aminopeptidase N
MADNMRAYFQEARRYKRPLETNRYPSALSMLDSHSYPKGAAVLHTLRRQMGDDRFFRGIRHYLRKHRHQPVATYDFEISMAEATGFDMKTFLDQWVRKPGHPVLAYSWTWDEREKQAVVEVRQVQPTSDGTPLYTGPIEAAALLDRDPRPIRRTSARLGATATLRIECPRRPDAVLLDPELSMLREIPNPPWTREELPFIVRLAPSAPDRQTALDLLMRERVETSMLGAALAAIRRDRATFPAIRSTTSLAGLRGEELRAFWREELRHANFDRRAQAVRSLGSFSATPRDTALLSVLVNEREPYAVVENALRALSNWDRQGNQAVLEKAKSIPSRNDRIRKLAERLLAEGSASGS